VSREAPEAPGSCEIYLEPPYSAALLFQHGATHHNFLLGGKRAIARRINILESLPCAIFLCSYEILLHQMPVLDNDAQIDTTVKTGTGEIHASYIIQYTYTLILGKATGRSVGQGDPTSSLTFALDMGCRLRMLGTSLQKVCAKNMDGWLMLSGILNCL
jgi:hypothetical protein